MKTKKRISLKYFVLPSFIAMLSIFSGIAEAVIIAGGPVYGGPVSVGGFVSCRLYNYGTTPVSISARRITTNTNVIVPLSPDSCNTILGVGKYCAFHTPISGNFAYTCRANVTGVDTRVSGVAEIQRSDFSVLNAVPLQK